MLVFCLKIWLNFVKDTCVCAIFVGHFAHVRAGAMEKAMDRLPLHFACANEAPVEIVTALLAACPDGKSA